MSGKKQVTFTTHDLSWLCQSAWASWECIDVVCEKKRDSITGDVRRQSKYITEALLVGFIMTNTLRGLARRSITLNR